MKGYVLFPDNTLWEKRKGEDGRDEKRDLDVFRV